MCNPVTNRLQDEADGRFNPENNDFQLDGWPELSHKIVDAHKLKARHMLLREEFIQNISRVKPDLYIINTISIA